MHCRMPVACMIHAHSAPIMACCLLSPPFSSKAWCRLHACCTASSLCNSICKEAHWPVNQSSPVICCTRCHSHMELELWRCCRGHVLGGWCPRGTHAPRLQIAATCRTDMDVGVTATHILFRANVEHGELQPCEQGCWSPGLTT